MIEETYWDSSASRLKRRVLVGVDYQTAEGWVFRRYEELPDNLSVSEPPKPECFYCGLMVCGHEQPKPVRVVEHREETKIPLRIPPFLSTLEPMPADYIEAMRTKK